MPAPISVKRMKEMSKQSLQSWSLSCSSVEMMVSNSKNAIQLAIFSIIIFFPCSINAEPLIEATYFCTEDAAGGIAYDQSQGAWRGSAFNAEKKFILHLLFIGRRLQEERYKDRVARYTVTLTDAGTTNRRLCKTSSSTSDDVAIIDGKFECVSSGAQQYRFNLRHNRFLAARLEGYIYGLDAGSETPYIAAGTCTKIP